jgi:hypothetical protein
MNTNPMSLSFGNSDSLSSLSNMPNVSNAITCWASNITLIKITQSIVDFEKHTEKEEISFVGVIQPLKAEVIKYDRDGQHSWEWLQIHSFSGSLNLKTTDRIQINGTIYKVMGIFDYSRNGYIEYNIVKDYQ